MAEFVPELKAAQKSFIEGSIDQWWRESNSLSVFVSGKTGTGKSTLVNSLLGEKVAVEGKGLDPETSEVTSHRKSIEGIDVIIWDSPGLQDGTNREQEYLNDIEMKCKGKIDLFLYCVSMKATRLTSGSRDIEAMCKLTDKLGKDIWKNAVIVLTFANKYIRLTKSLMSNNEATKAKFLERLSEWNLDLKECLMKNIDLTADVVENIAILPAGRKELPRLFEDLRPWLSRLWIESLAATRRSARPALIKMNIKRLKNASDIRSEEEFEDLLKKENIIIQDQACEVGKLLKADELMGQSIGKNLSRRVSLVQQLERDISAVLPFIEVINIKVTDYELPIGTLTVLEALFGFK